VLFIVVFTTFIILKSKGQGTPGAFTASMWFGVFISWMLRAMSLINNYTLWAFVILATISVGVLFLSGPD